MTFMNHVGVVSRIGHIGPVGLVTIVLAFGVHVSDQDAFVEKDGPTTSSTTFSAVSPLQCSNNWT